MRNLLVAVAAFLFASSAMTAEVGRLELPAGDVVVLHDDTGGVCPPETFQVFYHVGNSPAAVKAGMAGVAIPGCWVSRAPNVHMQFVDGDSGAVKIDNITWEAGKKPAAYVL